MSDIIYTHQNETSRIDIAFRNKARAGYLYREVDGYYVFQPEFCGSGFIEAWVLREIADKMDVLNKEWDAQVTKALNSK